MVSNTPVALARYASSDRRRTANRARPGEVGTSRPAEAVRAPVPESVKGPERSAQGRVIAVNLPIGGQVKKGDVLITLDATDISLGARRRAPHPQCAARPLQIAKLKPERASLS